jgi:hypothetical protein
MKHETEKPQCQRAEDLPAYLYNEVSETEKQDFTRHLEDCALCQTELASFQGVRAGMAAWRSEILRTAPARLVTDYAPASPQPSLTAAWAALREFFTLSPLWLRGATAFAGLAFVGLMVFTLTRSNAQPNVAVNQPNTTAGIAQSDVESRIAAAVQAERARLNAQHAQEMATLKTQNETAGERLATLQAALNKAQSNTPEPRIIKVRVPVPTPVRAGGTLAKGGAKNTSRRAPAGLNLGNDEETTASLSEVMFGGAGSRR